MLAERAFYCVYRKKAVRINILTAFLDGPDGIRTHGLCVANAALSQLSYEPKHNL